MERRSVWIIGKEGKVSGISVSRTEYKIRALRKLRGGGRKILFHLLVKRGEDESSSNTSPGCEKKRNKIKGEKKRRMGSQPFYFFYEKKGKVCGGRGFPR